MTVIKLSYHKLTGIVFAILFLLAQAGCSHKSQAITGKVVDESGNPLSGVTVSACYTGWGWASGSLVWDKSYCSKPGLTNEAGSYVINFKGPSNMRLMARKEGWIQLRNFNTRDSHIVLTSREEYNARQRAQEKSRESAFLRRRPGESDTAYYCRVILFRVHSINIEYQGETISITQALLEYGDTGNAFFALRGSTRAASSFAGEAQFVFNGKPVSGNFSLRSDGTSCKSDVHIIQATILDFVSVSDDRIEMLVPSIRAGWDMKIWEHSVTQQ